MPGSEGLPALLFAGESAVTMVESCLARIARLDPMLRAFITVTSEPALAAAHAADRARREGRWLGPLHGLPVAIKDCIDVAGIRCTSGSSFFSDRIAATDATVVARLKAAGAVILGKTNMHELAYGGTTQNAFFGNCRNPWDPAHVPGGSSGGSAVAVAAGLAWAAIGTDTGSSIRMPAALTGITGFRPTSGSVSAAGILPVSPPHDVAGPMARSVAEAAAILGAILEPARCGPRGLDAGTLLAGLDGDITGMRIAFPDDFFLAEADAAVADAVLAAVRVLERRGATIITRAIPGAWEAQANLMPLLFVDAAAFHRERLETAPEGFSVGVRNRLQPGLEMRAVDYAGRLRWLEAWRERCAAFFTDEADAMITPTVPIVAPAIGDDRLLTEVSSQLSRFCWAAPAAGLPALSVPCGFSGKLPVGMQILSGRWRDARVLNIGHHYQIATDWHRQTPPL